MRYTRALGAAAVLAFTGAAPAQSSNNVQLQLRLVPQAGLPSAGPVVNQASPATLTAVGQFQRYEIQHRIVDLNTGDTVIPAGLVSGNLTISVAGVTNVTLDRAVLSRFEAQTAGATPPTATDSSGANSNGAQGLHRPFRGGIPAPAPNNNSPANGVVAPNGLSITGITPLSLSQSDQGNANAGQDPNSWYGLYSFNLIVTAEGAGTAVITAQFVPDSTTGNRFGFFNDQDPVPWSSQNAQIATIDQSIATTIGACCPPAAFCMVTSPSGCAAMAGSYLGDNTSCSPTSCSPRGACCLADGTCTIRPSVDCSAGSVTYVGDNAACGPGVCPPAQACCRAAGTCQLLTVFACAAAGGVPQSAGTACGPIMCPPSPVQLQLRLVPQAGDPASGFVADQPASLPLAVAGQSRRFELQYRVLDLNASDVVVPAGLASGQVRITLTGAPNLVIDRALLSRAEAQLAGAAPPTEADSSGPQTGPLAAPNSARGMHRPFRAGIPAPAPNNTNAANGTISPDARTITGITPLCLSQSDQGNAAAGQDNQAWYGLYSFTVTATGPGSGAATITAEFDADPFTGNRFGYYRDQDPVPHASEAATPATLQQAVAIADPAAIGACCTGSGCQAMTAGGCAAASGSYKGPGISCGSVACPPPYGCCFPSLVCLVAMSTSDCLSAGGTPRNDPVCSPQACCPTPVITQSPQPVLLVGSQPVVFSAAVSHPGSLAYQWRKNTVPLVNDARVSGANSAVLTISSPVAGDAGFYDLVITSSCGISVTSDPAPLVVCGPPSIVTHPVALSRCLGQAVSLTVSAAGSAPLAYQWRRNGSPIPGQTGESLVIASAAAGDDADYDCLVTNPCGSAGSSVAHVSVNGPPAVGSPPTIGPACIGAPVLMTVSAVGGPAPLTYQWRKNGADITGATQATYTISSVSAQDAGMYSCRVTSACGSTTSPEAALDPRSSPAVTTPPSDLDRCPGQSASFSVLASGSAPLTYQWRKGGVNIAGATAPAYTIASVSGADAGSYDCVISNACGSLASPAATLNVLVPAAVTSSPAAISRCIGSQASFAVVASGTPPLSFQWRKNGTPVAGATLAIFSIASVAQGDAGSYDCVITNACASAISAAAALQVNSPPLITAQPAPLTVCEGSPASFSVAATGTAPLSYQWRRNGSSIAGATGASLTLPSAAAADAGGYDCVVTNTCGSATSSAAPLTLGAPPAVTLNPVSLTVTSGSAASLTIQVTGTPPLLYQWRRNGVPLAPAPNIQGAATATLQFSPVLVADDGVYDCLVANACGSALTTPASLVVSCAGGGAALDCNGNTICDALELVGLRDLTSGAPNSADRFGWGLATDGTRVVIGAREADTPAGANAGEAYVFLGAPGVWTREALLRAPDGEPGAEFGNNLAIRGQWVLVAARFATVSGQAQAGAVYVYRNMGSGWTFFQKITEPTPTQGAWFGHGLSIDQDRFAVGSMLGNGAQSRSGVLYVYRFNGVNWSREATLVDPDGQSLDGLGISVAIRDPYMIAGAPYDTEGGVQSGSACVFFRSLGGWAFQSKVRPRFPQAQETFGELVSISGDVAAVNAPRETVNGVSQAGVVYSFRRTDTRWTQQSRIAPLDPQVNQLFGYGLSLDGDTLATAAFLRTVSGVPGAGAVDVFKRRGNFWTRADRIESPKPEADGRFGYALALGGGRLAVSAYNGSAMGVAGAGWARVFDVGVLDCNDNAQPDVCEIASGTGSDANGDGIPDSCPGRACRGDFNGSGAATVQDIFDFLSDYFAGNLTADMNDSGVLSVQDIFDFLQAYFAGC